MHNVNQNQLNQAMQSIDQMTDDQLKAMIEQLKANKDMAK